MKKIIILSLSLFIISCTSTKQKKVDISKQPLNAKLAKAVFAGGCFWCVEAAFEKSKGIVEAISGYTGDTKENANYSAVSGHKTKHFEAVEVYYDPIALTYSDVLEIYWRSFDPTDNKGQFADRGHQYQPAIFYSTEEEKQVAIKSRLKLQKSKRFDKAINTPIIEQQVFYKAEDYHQDYYKKNPLHYKAYHIGSGRKGFIDKHWGDNQVYTPQNTFQKPSLEQIKKKLTATQFKITQENGTERPFNNDYWDNKKQGIYVDIVSGEPLFSSTHKFKSGTGWPSFSQPIEKKYVVDIVDNTFGMSRTEVRSKYADSHLGHVFNDGPKPTGLRYCINSASLKFIAKKDLENSKYEKYLKLFKN